MKYAIIAMAVLAMGCPSDDDNNTNNANNQNNENNSNNANNVNNANNQNNLNNQNNVNNSNNVNNQMDMGRTDTGNDTGGDTPPDLGPQSTLSFFVTSVGSGANGGDLGGLTGADAACQRLAAAAGAGDRTWQAYLSTSVEDARDRIGTGPWFNSADTMVAADVAALHRDGIPEADILDETGVVAPRNQHDILTGSAADGTAMNQTCQDWTSNDSNDRARVGHSDFDTTNGNWNSVHQSDCDEDGLIATAGAGRMYCFAVDPVRQ